ncbi:unnamed protein product, partial [Polarella glacialis]
GRRRSDDVALAAELWHRTSAALPGELGLQNLKACLAPPSQATLRTEFWPQFLWEAQWAPVGIHGRLVYEELKAGCEELAAVDLRHDSQEPDDRDEDGRPPLSLLLCLGTSPTMVAQTWPDTRPAKPSEG